MKKQFVAAAAVATIGIAGLGASAVQAESSTNGDTNPMSGLVEKLASKFNLNKDEVQQVFDEQRSVMEGEREQKIKAEVTQLVTDGKITQTQADAINAKRAELKAERESNKDSFKDKTDEERKSVMESKKSELDAWAKQHDIDSSYLRYVMGGGHGGPGGPRGERPTDTAE